MKYSIILPYIDRLHQLKKTLQSFVSLYNKFNLRLDLEVIIIEDSKNIDTSSLIGLIIEFDRRLDIVYIKNEAWDNSNPAPLYNLGVMHATGKYIILSSPECFHKNDILAGLDKEFEKHPDTYVICSCESLNQDGDFVSWYQHSIHRNAMYHFCSALKKDHYWAVGGFDARFGKGYCFDDDDFKIRVLSKLNASCRDDLVVCHQWHNKNYIARATKKMLWDRNKKLFESKHGKYIEPQIPSAIRFDK